MFLVFFDFGYLFVYYLFQLYLRPALSDGFMGGFIGRLYRPARAGDDLWTAQAGDNVYQREDDFRQQGPESRAQTAGAGESRSCFIIQVRIISPTLNKYIIKNPMGIRVRAEYHKGPYGDKSEGKKS